jgi:predicted ATPase/DNA-binding CsgD family transcriptional regulator/GAF domain-containing protein
MKKLFSCQYTDFNLIHENHKTQIYRAICSGNKQPVIIKSLNLNHPSEKDIQFFSNGYHIVKQLNHPELIQMIELKLGHKQAAYIMEDIGGTSLDLILCRQSLYLDDILEIIICALDQMQHIHDAGIVHLDINPSNMIWNSETRQLKIIDFETAIFQTQRHNFFQKQQRLTGSLPYISPEQTGKLNCIIDYRSDFYSLGITSFELLTGSKPFQSNDYQESIYNHIAKNPPFPSEINPDIPEIISKIVFKLMAKMPEERYQSHAGLKYDLLKCQKLFSTQNNLNPFPIATKDVARHLNISKKLYGRHKVIETITNIIQKPLKNKQLIFIRGDEGSGKTSLLKKIHNDMIKTKRFCLWGGCPKKEQISPYDIWVSAINEMINQWLSQGDQRIDQMKSLILMYTGGNASVLTNLIPNLALILGQQQQTFIFGQIEHYNLFNHMFCKFLKAISQEKERVILFDDAQWMDLASQKLLMTILKSRTLSNLTILISCQNDQLSQKFLNMQELDTVPDLFVQQVNTENISVSEIYALLYNSFYFPKACCQEFSQLLHIKTDGHVSFVHQMINTFYSEKLIYFDPDSSGWQVNLEQIKHYDIADNLVENILNQYHQLSSHSRILLEIASCMGDSVDKPTISSLIKQPLSKLNNLLAEPGHKGFIFFDSDTIQFSHKQIQQAIYDAIPEDQRKSIHHDIALQMVHDFKKTGEQEKQFDILFHYQQAFPEIQYEEKKELIHLNINSGIYAMNIGAYDSSVLYLSMALSMTNHMSFDLDRQLLETIYENRAKAYIILAEYKKAEHDVDMLLNNNACLKDKGRFCDLALQVYIMSNQFEKGLNLGLAFLKEAGIDIPEEITVDYAKQLLKETDALIEKSPEKLFYNLPFMTDETMQYAATILSRLMSFFYFIKPETISVCPCLSIHLYYQYGLFVTTPASLTTYAALQCYPDNHNYSYGFQLAEIAENLCYRNMNKQFLPYVIKVRYGFVACWQQNTYHCMEKMKEGVQAALDVGDNEMASYCYYNQAMFLFSSGTKLRDAISQCKNIVSNLELFGHEEMLDVVQQMLFLFLHLDSASSQPEQSSRIDNLSNTGYQQLILKLIQNFYQKEYTMACEYAGQAIKFIKTISYSAHITSWLAFYGALSFLSLTEDQRKHSAESSKYIELMELYYQKLPGILDNKYFLVKALESSTNGKNDLAIDFFEKAILDARQKKLIHDEALAHELAAEFFVSQGKTNTAKLYIEAALELYKEWGARGIITSIRRRYPQLTQQRIPATTSTATWEFIEISDLKTINDAIRIMNQKTDPDRPFYQALKFMVKISGAQKGLLFIRKNNMLEPVESIEINVDESINKTKNYPISMVNYVRHSKQMLVTQNDSDNNFSHDQYLKQNSIKSLLCMPLILHDQLSGIVYLENRSIPNLFSRKATKVLKVVFSQFALFVENQRIVNAFEMDDRAVRKGFNDNLADSMQRNATPLINQDLKSLNEGQYKFYSEVIQPQLNLLKEKNLPVKLRKKIVNNIGSEIKSISDSFVAKIEKYRLTASEKQIVFLLKQNFVTKEIADILNISPDTVNTHRKKIRKKMKLTSSRKNLVSYIKAIG